MVLGCLALIEYTFIYCRGLIGNERCGDGTQFSSLGSILSDPNEGNFGTCMQHLYIESFLSLLFDII